jgi:transcriptional regulator with XRE-family HTH domain
MPKEHDGKARDEESIWRDFGDMLRRLRLDRGLTVPKVVKLTGDQVSRDQIHKLEHGGYRKETGGPWETPNPRDDKLAALAKAYGAKVEDWFALVGRYDDRPRTQQSRKRSPTDQIRELKEENRKIWERNEELERRQQHTEDLLRQAGILTNGEPAAPQRSGRRRSST